MNLWGKKAKPAPTLSESITQLREAMEVLEKREQHLSKQMASALGEAKKKSKAKDKRGALFQLKRKKLYEKQIDQIYGKKTNIEIQIMTLEAAAGNTEVLAAMRKGADALKRTVKETDVEKVADVMDDINESMQLADELGEAMSQSIGPALDDEELNAELEQMENELNDEEMLKAPAVPVATAKTKVKSPVVAATVAPEKEAEVPKKVAAPKVAVVAGGGGESPAPTKEKEKPQRVLVMAGGGTAPAKKSAPAPTPQAEDDPEAAELKALEAQMGLNS
jgi:charged multivesicular body protein 4